MKRLTNTPPTTSVLSSHNPILRWMTLFGWAVIVLAHLVIFLYDLVFDYFQMLIPCSGPDCNFLAISEAEVAVLESWGLTTRTYALSMILIPVVVLLVYWALGGLILWRQGTSRFGLAVSLALIVIPITTYASDHDWSTSNPNLTLLGVIVGILGAFITLVFFYLIPNGRFSPRWAYIPLIGTLLLLGVQTMAAGSIITLPAQGLTLVNISLVSLVLVGGGLQIYRYLRDSNPIERQQTKWILAGILSYILSIIVWVLIFGGALDIPAGTPRLVANYVGWYSGLLTILALPAALTIAILRYRLWDIDILIRRTLQYSLLSGLLAFIYFGLTTLLQRLFFTNQQSEISIVLSALAIAALFFPLRNRVQDFIDKRFYRKKYDAQKVVDEFAATCRNETDINRLVTRLAEGIDETLQPEKVSVWIKDTKARAQRSEEAKS